MEIKKIINSLAENFSSVRVLLFDTENFLKNNQLWNEYESTFRELRKTLDTYKNSEESISEIKNRIVSIRKSLRLSGYDLKLGNLDINFCGFKSDDAIADGFRRMVLSITNDGKIYFISGTDNHKDLYRFMQLKYPAVDLNDTHSLWYRWRNNTLQLCGSDSEPPDNYEHLIKYSLNNKNFILKKIKSLP